MRKWVNWSIFGLVGLLLAIATLIFHYFILPIAIRYQVTKTLELKNGTEAWDRFVNTPIPVMLNVYFFNLDNPEGVLQGETPKVTQVGPYVYREKWEKVDIRIDEERDTIFYRQKIDFEFDQKQSGSLSDKDIVSIINPVVHVVTKIIDGLQALNLTNEVIEFALPTMARENYGPVFTASVHDILLGGVRIHCSGNLPFIVKFLCAAFKRFLPLPYLSLADNGDLMAAIFKFKELGPVMELNRGSRDPNMIGRIVSMDGRRKLTSWKCDSANIVDGYDMTMLSPFNKRTSIPLFTYDLQSTLQMQYETDVSFEGIGGYRFVLAPDVFGDPATNPKSRCYCPGSIKNLTIPPPCMKGSGVLDVSSCIGAPVILSNPHFYGASENYKSAVKGLQPEKNLHESFLELEPTTGVPLQGKRRIQVNVNAQKRTDVKLLRNHVDAVIPMMWIDEGASLGGKEISLLKDQLLFVMNIENIGRWILFSVGILFLVIGVSMAIIRKRQEDSDIYDLEED
ncbi:unnamed protein product [Nezara viridula]|uniref:Uncharacterized protein n=1 Tax=Nezara viridula TaxID=85310 RepID=A0A9P0EAU2_NEZVI|nr:unnamed protein product [Nezara viridula]